MEGAALRNEDRRAEIWFTAMLPHLEKPIPFEQFMAGETQKRAEVVRCIAAWDRMDRALMRQH